MIEMCPNKMNVYYSIKATGSSVGVAVVYFTCLLLCVKQLIDSKRGQDI